MLAAEAGREVAENEATDLQIAARLRLRRRRRDNGEDYCNN
jgi:hypothetical protein